MGFFRKYAKRKIAQGIAQRERRERERISKLQNLEERERVDLEERTKLKAPPRREKSAESVVWRRESPKSEEIGPNPILHYRSIHSPVSGQIDIRA